MRCRPGLRKRHIYTCASIYANVSFLLDTLPKNIHTHLTWALPMEDLYSCDVYWSVYIVEEMYTYQAYTAVGLGLLKPSFSSHSARGLPTSPSARVPTRPCGYLQSCRCVYGWSWWAHNWHTLGWFNGASSAAQVACIAHWLQCWRVCVSGLRTQSQTKFVPA